MTFRIFDPTVSLIYIHPAHMPRAQALNDAAQAGAVVFIDTVYFDAADPEAGDGLRVRLDRIGNIDFATCPAVIIAYEDAHRLADMPERYFAQFGSPILAEVGSADEARAAERCGAAAVIARGNEGPGRVSETQGFVLLQEALAATSVPVFLRGGVSLRTAAGARAAGAAGVVLDVHLMPYEDAWRGPGLREFLNGLSMPATVLLGESVGHSARVYARLGTKAVREFRKREETLEPGREPDFIQAVDAAFKKRIEAPDMDDALLPLSEDLTWAIQKAREFASVGEFVREFIERMNSRVKWPFGADNALCAEHHSRFPIVQGPMAHVSDSADFLAAVRKGGALPMMAMGNMPAGIARDAITAARNKTEGMYGVGLIGLDINARNYEPHLEIMRENPPPFAVLAAGGPDLAQRIEEGGTACYLHCAAPAMVSEGLKAGLRHFVFEGCESGGHIGTFGSLNLWSANLEIIETAAKKGLPLSETAVLFAGGIAGGRATAFIAGMVGDLAEKGLKVGLQIGTAYLTTKEAVESGAITETYSNLVLKTFGTSVIGRTVGIRARAAASPMASLLIEREHDRIREGLPLQDRKLEYEKDNLGALRLAAKGCCIDPKTATWDCPEFCSLEPEEQLKKGLYLMGQAVSMLNDRLTMDEFHTRLLEQGKVIFENRVVSAQASAPVRNEENLMETVHEKELIAIVGMGLRLPGAETPEAFWEQIVQGRSGIIEVPEGRWGKTEYYYDPDPSVPDKTYSKIGGFIPNLAFDPLKYRIPPSVAKKMDRTQQMAVVCAGDALTDAGLSADKVKGVRIGVMIGNSMGGESTDLYATRLGAPRALDSLAQAFDDIGIDDSVRSKLSEEFRRHYLDNLPEITEDSLPGELANVISGRVANVFNLEGPNFTVDAACASSMAAVMNAVSALRNDVIDIAVTGGVDAAMHPSSFVKFCKVGALSADGSRPFDKGANGFIMGEGAGMLVMKRLTDALRDGDKIYGTIIDIGSSSDGRGKGITAPNAAGQERALNACYRAAAIDPTSLGLVEAHGTSTSVGDATELKTLDRFLRDRGAGAHKIAIGSVKSQIGHLKAAAGVAGIIKATLSLLHKTLPPTINVKNPNPCINWDDSPLFLSTKTQSWECSNGVPRRSAVSAFGFGGTNFHILLQEYHPDLKVISLPQRVSTQPPVAARPMRPVTWPKPAGLVTEGEAWVVGGADPADLARKAAAIARELTPANMHALRVTHRENALEAEVRCGFAATDHESVVKKLQFIADAASDPAKLPMLAARGIFAAQGAPTKGAAGLAFLFPGQGSQYPYMLRDLAERFPVVAETLHEADEILRSLGVTDVTGIMFPDPAKMEEGGGRSEDAMRDTQILQPMILTANMAMFRLLTQFGLKPVACAGHSLGEYAACAAAGVFTFRDALEAVAVRGREMARVSIADPGLMMSIPADARQVEEVLALVDGYVVAANKNSPKQTVISGETAAVMKAGELFKERGIEGVLLPVSAAFHSGVVAPAREPFMKTLDKLGVNQPVVPVISNVTGDYYPIGPAAPRKIRDLLGKQFAAPVEWVKTLRKMYDEGIRVFVECGPKRVMTNLTLDTLPGDAVAVPTNHPKKGGVLQFMETLAALAVEGVPVKFDQDAAPVHAPAHVERPRLTVVKPVETRAAAAPSATAIGPLDQLLDDELREIARKPEFARYLGMQGDPLRDLLKSGFKNYVKTVLPLENTVRIVESEGMSFKPVVVSGISAGLPSDVRFPFDRDTLDDLILGRNFIKSVPEDTRRNMLDKNVERLVKGPSGEADLEMVGDLSGVIKLAGFFNDDDMINEYGLDARLVRAMDVTTKLAIAAGIEALRDAGIPLARTVRTTSTGQELPDAWALSPSLRAETGIIFASAFPGMASLVDEVTRHTTARFGADAKKRLIDFYTGLVGRVRDDRERDRITKWFTDEFGRLNTKEPEDLYTFNRDFLLKVMSMAHGQFAQLVKAQGPNTHIDAACAGTTQAVIMARDWIRAGRAKRVVVIAADDVAGKTLLPWVGSGFLSMGAATSNGNVSEAALPFDDRRHGLILGSAAAGVVIESADEPARRGMDPIATVEAGITANSAYHGTRLDLDHISSVMEDMVGKWERQTGRTREELAKKGFFMSHETYSPKRGGSSAAEIHSLRKTFGENVQNIPIANTKGFTGHTMGVGVEDIVAIRCLQKGMIPPIPNLRQPDPEFADLKLSNGGPCDADYAIRLAAGFGSQIVMALYKAASKSENRITDLQTHRNWLKEVTGYTDPVVSVEHRTLRVTERIGAQMKSRPAAVQTVQPVKKAVNAEAAPQSVPAVALSASPSAAGVDPDSVREQILKLLSDKTGYPPEMLDTGLDLEADLGIDTVKQAEFISDVREAFGIPRIEGLKIAEFPTIEHIIGFVLEQTGGGDASADGAVVQHEGASVDIAAVRVKILELLSSKTGYPAEMLDPELDLEADLGIDTVKQAEFISEVREMFAIPRIEGLKIAEFPTINHIVQFVLERSKVEEPVQPVLEAATVKEADNVSLEARLYEARLTEFPAPVDQLETKVDQVFLYGGTEDDYSAFTDVWHKVNGSPVVRLTAPEIPSNASPNSGIVNLALLGDSSAAARDTFKLCMSLAERFENGPKFLVSAGSEDGALGFEHPAEEAERFGLVYGATKSFSREYPDARVRALDLHPELSAPQRAEWIVNAVMASYPLETAVNAAGQLRTLRLVPAFAEETAPQVSPGDVILVTGGARGITAECVKALAAHATMTVVIMARTPLSSQAERYSGFGDKEWSEEKQRIIDRLKQSGKTPTPVAVERELAKAKAEGEVCSNIAALKSAGCEVIYRAADIIDPLAVDRAAAETAELCGRVDLVIHGAGIDDSRALKSKSLDKIEQVVDVKIGGMRNLMRALNKHGLPPRRIVGFGSVSGRFGNLAQIDYSAANDGLAHMMRRLNHEGTVTASIIDWAPWADLGMAVRGSVQQTLEAAGIDFVRPETGAALFVQEITRAMGSPEVLAAGRVGPFHSEAFELPQGKIEIAAPRPDSEVLEFIPGEYVKIRAALAPQRPLLDHHRINRAAVLPGVGGLDLMQSAAALLCPELPFAEYRNIEFRSPIKVFKEEPFVVEVEAIRLSSTGDERVMAARITSIFRDREGRALGSPRLHHKCRLVFTHSVKPAAPEMPMLTDTVRILQREIYETFFHGPAYEFLNSLTLCATGKEIRFVFQDTPERPDMFDLVPAAIEAVFQTCAGYGLETKHVINLPMAVLSAKVFSSEVPVTGRLLFRGEMQEGLEGRIVFTYDGYLLDKNGEMVMSFDKAQMIELQTAPTFNGRIFERLESVKDVAEKAQRSPEFLDDILSPEERREYESKVAPKRAAEWLSGRAALKSGILRMAKLGGNSVPALNSVRIMNDELGRPYIAPGSENLGIEHVSISHANGLAAGACAKGCRFRGFGIDIQQVESRSEAWAGDYFTAQELGGLNPADDRHKALTAMWCLKEATVKALGAGLRFDLKEIEVSRMSPAGSAAIALRGESAQAMAKLGASEIDASIEEREGIVTAYVALR